MDVKSLSGGSGCLCCDCAAGLACVTVLREWKISYALTWSTCLRQQCSSVTCGWGALPQKRCHTAARARSFSVELGLIWLCWSQQGWFSLSANPEFPKESRAAGTCQECISMSLSSWVWGWDKPTFSHSCFHSPPSPHVFSAFSHLIIKGSNLRQQSSCYIEPGGFLLQEECMSQHSCDAQEGICPLKCIPLPLLIWSCWCCSFGKIAAFIRLWLLSPWRQDWACHCVSPGQKANGLLCSLSSGWFHATEVSACHNGILWVVDLLWRGKEKVRDVCPTSVYVPEW